MDLSDPKLVHAMAALAPVKLRIGGTLADFVAYNVSDPAYCTPQVSTGTGKVRRPSSCRVSPHPNTPAASVPCAPQWDFRGGCLSMQRWSAIHDFCAAAGCGVVFGLSELFNRPTDDAHWDPRNTRALLEHTRAMPNERLFGVELGNEVGGPHGILAHLTAEQVATDFRALRAMLDDIWAGDAPPLLIGPDAMIDVQWVGDFLAAVGNDTLDAFTYHLYLGAGSDPALMTDILTPQFLYDKGQSRALKMVDAVRSRLPRTPLWMGEAGGAYNSGQNTTTNAFVSGFWYLDQLGGFATAGHQTHCRCVATRSPSCLTSAAHTGAGSGCRCSQTFCGGNYGLVNVASHEPQPDYWKCVAAAGRTHAPARVTPSSLIDAAPSSSAP